MPSNLLRSLICDQIFLLVARQPNVTPVASLVPECVWVINASIHLSPLWGYGIVKGADLRV